MKKSLFISGFLSILFCAVVCTAAETPQESAAIAFQKAQERLAVKLFDSEYAKSSLQAQRNTEDYYVSLVSDALNNAIALNMADSPASYGSPYFIGKPGLLNPDTKYTLFMLKPEATYTIDVVRGSHTQLLLQLLRGYPQWELPKSGPVIDLTYMKPGERKTIYLGGPPRDTDWYPLDPDIRAMTVRETFSDWVAETPSTMNIRNLSAHKGLNRPITEPLRQAATNLDNISKIWFDTFIPLMHKLPANKLRQPKASVQGGLTGQMSVMAQYILAPDEAMIITSKADLAQYQGIQLGNPWFVTPDFSFHQNSLNHKQARVDADGYFRYVISLNDPGVPNWLDAAANPQGFIFMRWQGVPENAKMEEVTGKIVKLADLRKELPADTPTITPKERLEQLAIRSQPPQIK